MKKLVVLTLLLAAGMLWAQAAAPAAPTFTMGLTLDYMWAQDFGPGKEFSDRPILELKFSWKADDFTTAYVELEEGPLASQGDTSGLTAGQGGYGRSGKWSPNADRGFNVQIAGLDNVYFTTDLGAVFKLPVPTKVMYGLKEWQGWDTGIRATKTEYEDFLGEADIRTWAVQLEVAPSPMVTLRFTGAWNGGATDALVIGTDQVAPASWATDGNQALYLIGAYGTVAPISYELTYFSNNNEMGKGWIEGGVKFAQDMTPDVNVAVIGAFEYDLQDDPYPAYGWGGYNYTAVETSDAAAPSAAPNAAYMLQAGAQVMFQKMASFGVSWRGAEDMLSGAVQLQAWAMPLAGKPLEVMAQVGLGLDSDVFDETLDSYEIALRYTIGKTVWYFGYLFNAEYGRAVAKEWADFDIAGVYPGGTSTTAGTEALRSEAGAIFMRGRIAL